MENAQNIERLRRRQVCNAVRYVFRLRIPSASTPSVAYVVEGEFRDGRLTCTCPGFKFRGTCKHTELEEECCGWDAVTSPEPQTMEQKRDHVCPRCGSPTVDVARGD